MHTSSFIEPQQPRNPTEPKTELSKKNSQKKKKNLLRKRIVPVTIRKAPRYYGQDGRRREKAEEAATGEREKEKERERERERESETSASAFIHIRLVWEAHAHTAMFVVVRGKYLSSSTSEKMPAAIKAAPVNYRARERERERERSTHRRTLNCRCAVQK